MAEPPTMGQAATSAGRELDLFLAAFDPSDLAAARDILRDAGEATGL
jgi:hypothetical protein